MRPRFFRLVLLLVCAGALFCPLRSSAQSETSSSPDMAADSVEGRKALLRAARARNSDDLHSPRKTSLERFFLWVEENQLFRRITGVAVRKLRLLPGGLGRGSGAAVRLAYVPFPGRSELDVRLSAGGSVRGYWQFLGSVGYRTGPGFGYAFSQVQKRPETTYLALQNGAVDPLTPLTVELTSWTSGGVFGLRPTSELTVAVSGAYLRQSAGSGTPGAEFRGSGVLPPATATRYATLGAHVTLDRRDVRYTREFGTRYVPSGDDLTDRPLNPDHGTLLSLDYLRFRELSDVDASFSQLRLEAQQYVSFFNGYHTFALRHRSTFTDPDVGEVVPFYWLPYAGGNFTVRGYDEFRFQGGRHGVLYNLEYRYKVWHHADVVLFGDAGKVFDSIEEWGVTNLRYSYGAEIRFTTPRTTLFRVGVAFDENHSSRLVFEFSNVF